MLRREHSVMQRALGQEVPGVRAGGRQLVRAWSGDTRTARRAMRLLCVEDNPVNRRVLEALLAPLEANIIMAENGQLGVETWESQEFDIIFMDIHMPVMDGIQATAEIRARERSSGRPWTPIVAVTANSEDHMARTYFQAGIDAVVPKPVNPVALFEAILSTLSAGRVRAEA